MSKKIIKNAAKCRLCAEVIESVYTHELVTCNCGEISVQGGHNYIGRFATTEFKNIIDLSEYTDDE